MHFSSCLKRKYPSVYSSVVICIFVFYFLTFGFFSTIKVVKWVDLVIFFWGGYFVSFFMYVLVVCSDINHSNGEY